MKKFYNILLKILIILLVVTPGKNTVAQVQHNDNDNDNKHEKRSKIKPGHLPKQVITQATISIGPVHEANFQQLADSELAHPMPSRTGFIGQGEDKDADFKPIPHHIPAGTPVFDPNQLAGQQSNQPQHQKDSPAPTGYFLATDGNGSLIPPDVDGSAGPTYVMETNNQQFDIYTKSGTLYRTLQIDNFFSTSGGKTGSYFDPHILYDNTYNKFIVVIDGNINSNGDGGLFVAISQTSDPTGSWWFYDIDNGDASANDLLDYPQVGYNTNWVVITANDFIGNNVTEDIYVLNRASLYSGTLGTVKLFTDNNAFSWAPAQTFDPTEDTLWMVQDANGASGAMQIGCISGTIAAPAYNAGGNIAVTSTWNENAIDVGQKGSTQVINDDDTRVGNGSVYINGTLWFTHTIYLPATGTATYSGVDWWQIVPHTLTVKQFGRIQDANTKNTNYYYPSLNVNSNGDALLGYCMSGTDSFYASAAYSFHAAADPVNFMESRYIYKAGTVSYYETLGGGRNRYGDYTGTSVDPNDQSFWNYSEYPINGTTWGVVIAHVGPSVPPTNPPVASFSASDTALTCLGTVQFTDLSTNLPTSWLWNFGDGTTSTTQNPSHQYTTNGTYTVTLKATNTYGSGTQSLTAYITINLPVAPAAANVTHCAASTFSLAASTTNNVGWFDSTGTLVSSANPFVTPVINHTTTYWMQDTVAGTIDSVGPATYTTLGAGGTFTATNQHYQTFDALSNFTLISVLVDASTAGARTIQLINSGGTVIATATPTIPVGVSTVTLNFAVPAGTGYELSIAGTVNLYRNNAVNAALYPFTIPGVVSITGNDVGTGYYYYFYNWKVKGPACISAQRPVSAIVGSGSLSITPTIAAVACYGLSTGSVSLNVSGGTPNYTYAWSNNQTGSSISNLASGTYIVTITDAGGCSTTASENVAQPAAALAGTAVVTNVTCNGSSTGSINLTVTGGTTSYNYNWGSGISTQNRTGIAAGGYTVTITDAHSCTATVTANISQNAAIVANAASTATGCGTSATGTATVAPTGGVAGYTYHWGGGQTTATVTGLAAGNYPVTITDNAGCSITASATVAQGSSNLAASATVTNANCNGQNTGAINLAVSGGATNYTYNWGSGITTQNRTNLAAGTYNVTVTDANLCTTTATAVVGQPAVITAITTATNAGCGSSSSGSASVAVSGGTASYTYAWSNTQTSDTILNLTGGNYTVTVTDSHSCSATALAAVSNSGSLLLTPTVTAANCYGYLTGSASVNETGGVGNITYMWSNDSSVATISNLGAGTYKVTVSDGNGCTNVATEVVGQPDSIALGLITSPAACGLSNGSANVTVSGGTSGYTYHWNTGATTAAIGGLAGGSYTVTVADAHTCSATASTVIASSSSIVANLISSNTTCNGFANGGASASITTGTAPFTYLWNNGGTVNAIGNLTAGTYYVTITDSFGCHSIDSVVVNQPAAISIVINASQPPCNGTSATGSATLTVTGGNSTYTYSWSTGATTNAVSGLLPGSYPVTVKDGNGCSASADLTINTTAAIGANLISVNDSCYGGQDGHVQVTASGGSNPYTYLWSNGDTSSALNNLAIGTYTVTVTDAHNCSTTTSANISEPGQIQSSTSITNATNGQSNGSAIISNISGGVPPYTISWSSGQTDSAATNLLPGNYTATVTDKNGCRQTVMVTVGNITDISNVAGTVNFDIYPNPAKTEVIVDVPNVGSQTEVWLKDILGQVLYIRPISANKTTIDLNLYANGIYFIEVTEGHDHSVKKLIISK